MLPVESVSVQRVVVVGGEEAGVVHSLKEGEDSSNDVPDAMGSGLFTISSQTGTP